MIEASLESKENIEQLQEVGANTNRLSSKVRAELAAIKTDVHARVEESKEKEELTDQLTRHVETIQTRLDNLTEGLNNLAVIVRSLESKPDIITESVGSQTSLDQIQVGTDPEKFLTKKPLEITSSTDLSRILPVLGTKVDYSNGSSANRSECSSCDEAAGVCE